MKNTIAEMIGDRTCYQVAKYINENCEKWGYDQGVTENYLQKLKNGASNSPSIDTYNKVAITINHLDKRKYPLVPTPNLDLTQV